MVAAPRILSDEWMLSGRQQRTGAGCIIHPLAVAPDCRLGAVFQDRRLGHLVTFSFQKYVLLRTRLTARKPKCWLV
jgi:hypothetical protein